MQALDPRIVRIGVEVSGQLRTYDDLWVKATGVKFANPLQNECTVEVANLAKEVRDFLQTETSPYNRNRTPKRLIVEAGRASTGAFRLFTGDITEVQPGQAPDITLTIKAKTGQFRKGEIVARSKPPLVPLSVLAADIARDLGVGLLFEARERNIANYSFTGAALKQVDKLAQVGSVNVYIDDGQLIVKDYNAPLRSASRVLSEETGLIGIPEPTEQGVKVRYLLDPQTRLGGRIELRSVVNPAMSGRYVIYKLGFEISSRDTPFYTIAECKREGSL